MSRTPHELTHSDAYEVSAQAICERLKCSGSQLSVWQRDENRLIPRGKRRPCIPGIWFTVAQANKLIERRGLTGKVEPFVERNI